MSEQLVESHVSAGPRLTWEEFEGRPEEPGAEYVDGQLLRTPTPSLPHQEISTRLAAAQEQVLPSTHDVVLAWAWKPAADEFAPDVMVFDTATARGGGLYAPTAVHGRRAVADLDLGIATVRVDVAELLG